MDIDKLECLRMSEASQVAERIPIVTWRTLKESWALASAAEMGDRRPVFICVIGWCAQEGRGILKQRVCQS